MWRLVSTGLSTRSMLQMEMLPALGARLPVSICMVVVLPAPLGPSNPRTSPRRKVKSMSRTAACAPNCRDSCRALTVVTTLDSMTQSSKGALVEPGEYT